jgi:hypothetical protein
MLIVALSSFVLGGAVAVGLYLRFKTSPFWAVLAGIAVYIAADFLVQFLLFGHIGRH